MLATINHPRLPETIGRVPTAGRTLLVARKGDKQGLSQLVTMALAGAVESIFSPPVIFVFDKDGLRLLERRDVV